MNTRYYILSILLLLIPFTLFGQVGQQTPEDTATLLQFLKGDGAFEKWFMEVFTTLDTEVEDTAIAASYFGRAIGAFGMLIYLSYLGFQMQEGARPWEVTPMIKPIMIGFILIFWTGFTNLIQAPLQLLAEPGAAIFQDIEQDANDMRIARFVKQQQLLNTLIHEVADEKAKGHVIDQMGEGNDKSWWDEKMDELFKPIYEFALTMEFHGQKLVGDIMEAIALAILRVCTYLIFFIQKIWAYVLITLGPIAVGISLIPGFENSFYNWVAKFININLYTFIAYIIINIGQQLIIAGYQMEIDRMNLFLDDGGVTNYSMFYIYVKNNGIIHTTLFPVVAYIITGIGVLMTPTIADTIVSGGGAGIMSKAKGAGGKILAAANTVANVKTAGIAQAISKAIPKRK